MYHITQGVTLDGCSFFCIVYLYTWIQFLKIGIGGRVGVEAWRDDIFLICQKIPDGNIENVSFVHILFKII